MALVKPQFQLQWVMKLGEGGYVCHELVDGLGCYDRRWGWIVAPTHNVSYWVAHTGAWGQSFLPIPLTEALQTFTDVANAKAWVETEVSAAWMEHPNSLLESQ